MEQVQELTKVVSSMAVKYTEESRDMKRDLVKLKLNVGSHTR